jgi:hypothetical protein
MEAADGSGATRGVDRSPIELLTKEPSQIKLSTLIALCTALDCTPNDLFEIDTTPLEQPATPDRAPVEATKAVGGERRSMPPL